MMDHYVLCIGTYTNDMMRRIHRHHVLSYIYMYMNIYARIYIYIYNVCIFIYMYIDIFIYADIFTDMDRCICINVHIHIIMAVYGCAPPRQMPYAFQKNKKSHRKGDLIYMCYIIHMLLLHNTYTFVT